MTPVVVGLLANDTDADGDPLTVTSATLNAASDGTLTQDPVTLAWTFTPAAGFTGDAIITYTMQDQDGGTEFVAAHGHCLPLRQRAAGARSDRRRRRRTSRR